MTDYADARVLLGLVAVLVEVAAAGVLLTGALMALRRGKRASAGLFAGAGLVLGIASLVLPVARFLLVRHELDVFGAGAMVGLGLAAVGPVDLAWGFAILLVSALVVAAFAFAEPAEPADV